MAYIHQAQALKALKNLYMLGNQPYRGGKSGDVGEGGALGGFTSAATGFAQKAAAPKPKPDPRRKVMADAIENQMKQRTMAEAIQRGQMEQAIQQAKQAQNQLRLNDAATNSQVGGSFTRSGFEDHARQTDRNTNDLLTSRRLMQGGLGMGGSVDPLRGR